MRTRYGRERRRNAVCGAMAAVLAVALAGAVPAAFAEGASDAPFTSNAEAESAFRLGHVTIAYEEVDAPAEPLDVGVPQARTYRIMNQGEMSYIRLASRTLSGELEHINDRAVTEAANEDDSLWHLADDGYWYRSVPLEIGETITVQVSVEIPFDETWLAALSTGSSAEVVETLDIQALQERNKDIDLASADPWGVDGVPVQPDTEACPPEVEGGDR